ncbi:probable calcium-binding protein CML46 [Phragmites australis]|uniref:probable calcium-binding protein CML46 n=1 Tax=Phragmites australis TaxID=29695 RepID=UPI002D7944E2|nr:probable calcium-binding protein CML46 [Phragmites australis]
MEKSPATATCHSEPFLQEQCGIILFLTFLTWSISNIQRLLPSSCRSCNCKHNPAPKATPAPVLADTKIIKTRNTSEDDETELTHEDIKTVMRNIGFGFGQENGMVFIGNGFVSRIFNDDEPSLQEVRQAFLVFDDNDDGYIDALDLHRVLRSLGLGEGVGVDECEQMIARYDVNKDKRIDLVEFTKVLEASIC